MSYTVPMSETDIFIVKSNGQRERFNLEKLRHSLRRSGATPPLGDEISVHVQPEVLNGITNDEVYRHAFA